MLSSELSVKLSPGIAEKADPLNVPLNTTEPPNNTWALCPCTGFFEPEMKYNDNQTFIQAVNKCISYVNLTTPPMERVPSEIIVSMAILETGYGKSRFALQGNNLFGIRNWNKD